MPMANSDHAAGGESGVDDVAGVSMKAPVVLLLDSWEDELCPISMALRSRYQNIAAGGHSHQQHELLWEGRHSPNSRKCR